MALTINQEPSTTRFVPVNNPIEYLVNSTNTAQPNFKLSCKIIVGGAEQVELKYDVIPGTAFVISEIQRLLEGYLEENYTTNLFSQLGETELEPSMKVACRAVFQEWYSDPSSALPTYQGSQASGNTFYIWNGAFKYREWQANEWHDYTVNGTAPNTEGAKFLTAFNNQKNVTLYPSTYAININSSDRFKKVTPSQLTRLVWNVSQLPIGGGDEFSLHTNFYNYSYIPYKNPLAFTQTRGTDILNSSFYLPNVVAGYNVMSKNFNIDMLKDSSNYNFESFFLNYITSEYIKYFTLHIYSDNTSGTAESYTKAYLYEIDWDACSQYDSYEIHWLNHLGGWDSWVFNKNSSKQIPVTRSFYSQPVTRRISSNTIVHDSYARKKRQFHTNISERFTVNSGMLLDWEYDGLIDLLQSPLVYWRHPDYGFIAINIMEQDVIEVPRQITDKAYNLSFVFEINNNDKLQGL